MHRVTIKVLFIEYQLSAISTRVASSESNAEKIDRKILLFKTFEDERAHLRANLSGLLRFRINGRSCVRNFTVLGKAPHVTFPVTRWLGKDTEALLQIRRMEHGWSEGVNGNLGGSGAFGMS